MVGANHRHPLKTIANQGADSMVGVENMGSPMVSANHKVLPMVGANHRVPKISNWPHIYMYF
jgi:hypothetical protein